MRGDGRLIRLDGKDSKEKIAECAKELEKYKKENGEITHIEYGTLTDSEVVMYLIAFESDDVDVEQTDIWYPNEVWFCGEL